MRYRRFPLLMLVILVLVISACGQAATPTPTSAPATQSPTQAPTQPPTAQPTAAPSPTAEPAHTWPESIAPEEDLSRTPVSQAEQTTFDTLANLNFVANDPIALAIAVKGVEGPVSPIAATEAPTLKEGTVQTFWVHNTDTNEWSQVEARLERVTEHAYLWFDTSRELVQKDAIDKAAMAFETMYKADRAVYGSEWAPGIDGDPHVYVLHAAATALCNVTESTAHQCSLLGYFSTTDELPVAVEPHSNQHEMFIMNMDKAIGGEQYLTTLVHEFRHMIEHNYDRHDDDWEVEGTAVMAEDLLGYPKIAGGYGDSFTSNTTDLQLNVWSQGASAIQHYGQGYTFARYIYDRMGPEFYSAWVQHPDRGFFALDAVLQEQGYDFNAHDLWLDWATTISLLGFDNTSMPYAFGENFYVKPPKRTPINKFPKTIKDTVNQYAFDVYDVRGKAPVQINFTGTTKVAVLEGLLPASGQYMWWSGRANQSDMNLTREVDLTGVDKATLEYDVYYSLERGYDFAYVLVSTDGGQTWQALVSDNMQGEKASDDPGDNALTDRFYTGRTQNWVHESIDLSKYAGQKVLLRFQYITDAIFTGPGVALDNIAIPEIGFYDDAETPADGWQAQGFTRVTAYEPQRFHLVLVTFGEDGAPQVERIPLAADNTASFEVPLSDNSSRALLLVAASNPLIMTPAHYQIEATP